MGKLKADLERIKRAKKQIDAYIQVHKQCIGKISNNASQLAAFWEGSDALAFQTQFERLIGNGSESEVLLKKMVSLSEILYASLIQKNRRMHVQELRDCKAKEKELDAWKHYISTTGILQN